MTAHGQYKEADYVLAQFLHLRPRPAFAVVGVLLLLLAIWTLWATKSLIMLGCLAYLVFCALYIPYKAKRTFRQFKAMSEPIDMELRDEGLFFKREHGEALIPWSHIRKWRGNKKLVLIYPTSTLFHLVPSHFFAGPEAFHAFHEALRSRLGNAT